MAGAVNFSSEPQLSALDPDTLFSATISAFTCLIQPKRSDLIRIDALLIPLYHKIGDYTKRDAATKLSGVSTLPSKISSLLCSEPLEISAPILMAIAPLEESAMLHAIAKHGNGHLKLISQRKDLPASVQSLCMNTIPAQAAEKPIEPKAKAVIESPLIEEDKKPQTSMAVNPVLNAADTSIEDGRTKAEKIRDDLLDLMKREEEAAKADIRPTTTAVTTPITAAAASQDNNVVMINTMAEPVDMRQLVRYATDGETGLLATKISDHLDIDYSRVRRMLMRPTYSEFLVCLKALYCDSVTAFAICAPFYADKFFAGGAAIALFYERADALTPLEAQRMVADWRLPHVKLNNADPADAANEDDWRDEAADYLSSAS